jgi:hypothetical protein
MEKNPQKTKLLGSYGGKEDHLHQFEEHIKSLGKKNLDLTIKKLNFLCLHFDPYALERTTEAENIINEYELDQFCSNPFEFTNIVLQMLDKTENLIKSREH